jgi:oxygen-independent coproporphyrinogen-3 oxidase
MVEAIASEVTMRSSELKGQKVSTLYFGGGTPSVLSTAQLRLLFGKLSESYDLSPTIEVTLEANPEDIDAAVMDDLVSLGITRLSMGIQSFDDAVLKSMNRSHDSLQALHAVRIAQHSGIENISVDIIYGLPGRDLDHLALDVEQFIDLKVPHISAYALTIEKGTLYHHQVQKGSLIMPDDDLVEKQFFALRGDLIKAGYEHYEVSNFAQPGGISRHNSAYWKGVHYLGLGPSAHSYDGNSRSWNVANNYGYMKAIEQGSPLRESEALDQVTRYNEYVLTRLRTKWGLSLDYLSKEFGVDIIKDNAAIWRRYEGRYHITNGHLILDPEGLILADGLASDLFQIA